MTNAELLAKIKAEIERRMDKHWEGLPDADSPEDDWTHNELCELGAYKELEHLETFLSSLESEKPVPNDLEEAANEFANQDCVTFISRKKGFIAGAKWQKEQDDKELSEKIASAYQLGLADKEKQMLKEAVEGEVYKFGEVAYVKERSNAELTKYLSQFNNGDRVKIIVIHETDIR